MLGIDDARDLAIIRISRRHLVGLDARHALGRLHLGELACRVVAVLDDAVRSGAAGCGSRARARWKRADGWDVPALAGAAGPAQRAIADLRTGVRSRYPLRPRLARTPG